MLKKTAFFISLFLFLPITGYTLGFGDITVFSKLNEPLKVQIELLNSQTTLLDEIIIKNANRKTYRRANLPRPDVFNKVKFKTKKINNGFIIVELTTKHPVREPFITFIADLKSHEGHLNREYTFLLDPPEFIQKHIDKAKPKNKRTAKKYSIQKSQAKRSPRPATHRKIDYSSVIANHIDDETYSIKRADTLWNIAKKIKPNSNVTTYQTMQALYALNPNAFIKNNIDLLKVGQTLKIPTQNEILQINGKPQIKDSSASNRPSNNSNPSTLSQQQKSRPVVDTSKKVDDKSNTQSFGKSESIENGGKLTIIPTTEVLLKNPVTSKKDLILINRALTNSITAIKTLKTENQILSDKISALTQKLNNLDNHNLNLNKKITEITLQLDKKKGTIAQETPKSLTPRSFIPVSNVVDEKSISTENSVEVDSTLAKTTQKRSFIRELLTSPVITIALAIFTIIILVTALFTIRNQNQKRLQRKKSTYTPYPDNQRKKDPHARPDDSEKATSNANTSASESTASSLQGTDIADDKEEDDMDFFEYFEKKINAPDAEANTQNSNNPEKKSTSTTIPTKNPTKKVNAETETGEVNFNLNISPDEIEAYEKSIRNPKKTEKSIDITLGEIDTYMAYGNYNEAEIRLLQELKQTPSDKNIHLKLFECYTYSNKRYEFIKHAQSNINLLNIDMILRHRIENIFQQTWNEPLDINNFK